MPVGLSMGRAGRRQVLPVADGAELEGACESLMLLLDRRQAFYRHSGVPGGGAAATGVEGADLLSILSEEDWRRGVGFADWVSVARIACSFTALMVAATMRMYVDFCWCLHIKFPRFVKVPRFRPSIHFFFWGGVSV